MTSQAKISNFYIFTYFWSSRPRSRFPQPRGLKLVIFLFLPIYLEVSLRSSPLRRLKLVIFLFLPIFVEVSQFAPPLVTSQAKISNFSIFTHVFGARGRGLPSVLCARISHFSVFTHFCRGRNSLGLTWRRRLKLVIFLFLHIFGARGGHVLASLSLVG